MKQNQVVAGHLLIIFTQVVLGLNIPVTLLNYLSPFAYIGIRAAVTALFFWIVQIFAKKQKIERKDFMLILLGGFLGFVFSQYLTSLSLKYTTPIYFSLILALSPVVVLILQSIFFNQKITKRKMLGIAFGIFGAAILTVRAAMETGAQGSNNLLGILFAVVSVSSFCRLRRNLCRHQSQVSRSHPDEMDFQFKRLSRLPVLGALWHIPQRANSCITGDWAVYYGNCFLNHFCNDCCLHFDPDRHADGECSGRQHLYEPAADRRIDYCHSHRHGRLYLG